MQEERRRKTRHKKNKNKKRLERLKFNKMSLKLQAVAFFLASFLAFVPLRFFDFFLSLLLTFAGNFAPEMGRNGMLGGLSGIDAFGKVTSSLAVIACLILWLTFTFLLCLLSY